MKNLVIVESPAKAKTIEKFLGKDFTVKSCFGHVRDLSKKQLSIDIEKGFVPQYEVTTDKVKVVNELKKASNEAELVWLASDEDREGEAISWHLMQVLNLDETKTRRIVFNEITKPAILHAIENPRTIDINLVDAQQARRVLDRLVGYEVSPVLWKKVKPALSAGRVQSVSVRLIVEREEEIKNFKSESSFKVVAVFNLLQENNSGKTITADLNKRFENADDAHKFLSDSISAVFKIEDIETKPGKRSPAPPFTTSTLQQEASRKLGFSVAKTMMVAQQLYESGHITYMRTDSVNLSNTALSMAKEEIKNLYGEKYLKIRKYANKSKGAQEAHEAIRPTYLNRQEVEADASQRRLYELIWKRTIASQMSDAELEKTNVTISVSTRSEKFKAFGEVIRFDGFLKVYLESTDEEEDTEQKGMLPPVSVGENLGMNNCKATQTFTQHPPRYTEASLVKKLEELGIGRPSTYAPTISTIQKREYVVKEDRDGIIRELQQLTLQGGKIKSETKKEKTGFEKGKLFPTDIGILVNQFLVQHFSAIVDYQFTAKVEVEFDEIAQGKKVWNKMLSDFYEPFHKQVELTNKNAERFSGERLLGTDPKSGKNVFVKIGRYGPIVQIGDTKSEEKPLFASLKKGQSLESVMLEDALDLFKLPRTVGVYENEEMIAAIGRFGPYIKHGSSFYSIPKGEDPLEIEVVRAIEIIEAKRKSDVLTKEPKVIGQFEGEDISIAKGRFGPYLKHKEGFYSIPRGEDLLAVGQDRAIVIILEKRESESKKIIKEFEQDKELRVLNGRYGAYISYQKENYKIPKDKNPEALSFDECMAIVGEGPAKSKASKPQKAPAKKGATRKK